MRRLVLLLLMLGVLATPISAQAITGGQLDGNTHPNVGSLLTWTTDGSIFLCSGTLISPTVVLTAAHCVAPEFLGDIESVSISFDAQLNWDPQTRTFNNILIPGTGIDDPRWIALGRHGGGYDMGVFVLDQPASNFYPGISPAPLPSRDFLDQFKTGSREVFTVVGYGVDIVKSTEPPKQWFQVLDDARHFTTAPLQSVKSQYLLLQGNQRDSRAGGGHCYGDSGGPVFHGTTVVAVISFGPPSGTCPSMAGNIRADTDSARAFLSQFVAVP